MTYTILFVENDEGVHETTGGSLAAAGFRILVAKNASEAMGLLAENKVDVLFTDILMPGQSGIELARRVKQRHPEIKIMFMTGYYPLAAEAQTLGKSLLKPVRPVQLVEELTRLLAA